MAKAAYCAACGANVYLNDDGLCPHGHGPENLSNHYEAPDLTPAEWAHYDAAAPVEKRKTNKTLVIVLVIVGVLIVCGIIATVAGVIGFSTIAKSTTESISEDFTVSEDSGEDGIVAEGESDVEFDAETELVGLTSHFFPGFQPTTYYLVGEGSADPLQYQIVAVADDVPDFTMIFTAMRYAEAASASDTDPEWAWETGTGAAWVRSADYTGDAGVSLSDFAGQESFVDASTRAQVMTDFVAAHPGKIFSDFAVNENGDLGLLGIDGAELDDWMGDATSFESWWTADIDAATWVESSFTD